MKKKEVLLFAHADSLNRGCEAIIRSTSKLLIDELGKTIAINCTSSNVVVDLNAEIPYITRYIPHNRYHRWSPSWIAAQIVKRIFRKMLLAEKITNHSIIRFAQRCEVCFSVGGDNYCYQKPNWLYAMDAEIKKRGKKLVLWGCSIEPGLIDVDMEIDLNLFDLIIARESFTYSALMEHGFKNKLRLCADPAFTMEREELPLPENWQVGNMIGLNISPLIMRLEKTPGIAYNATEKLMGYILENTDLGIALIPHVIWESNNDLDPLGRLYDSFKDSKRVVLISGDYNAPQLKGFISRCRMFIGARTHATIAAYSTNVPTLVLGYSVKARGIARDIFGDESGLVLPVQNLTDDIQLINAFEGLRERELELRRHLQRVMPDYIASAYQAVQYVKNLFEK